MTCRRIPALFPLRRSLPGLGAVLALAVAGCASVAQGPAAVRTTLISGALIYDGTGAPPRMGSVRLEGERILAVGQLDRRAGDDVIDAHSLALAPGFIDTHSHHDVGLFEAPGALAAISQGITTIVVGQDGMAELPVEELLRRADRKTAVNVAVFAGHGAIRSEVMGEDFRRAATAAEVERMRAAVGREMRAGALGLSSGLEYDPGIYATQDELIVLAGEAGRHGGRYFSHIRSEDRGVWAALDELVDLGRRNRMPVHVSHMKLAMVDWWGQAQRYVRVLDDARAEGIAVTGDVYPYEYWNSTMTVLFPERKFDDLSAAQFALRSLVPPELLIVATFSPEPALQGRSLAQIAQSRGQSAERTLLALIAQSQAPGAREEIIATSMQPADVAALIQWPHSSIGSDGLLDDTHPRGVGAFTRVLREYVRERGLLTLEAAIRKMTSLSAGQAGLVDRGVVRAGAYADLVLFDPATVTDRSSMQQPHALSDGIETVWVGGERVWHSGRPTGVLSGRAVRRAGTAP